MNIFTTRSKSEKLRKAFFSAFLIVSLVLSQAALPLTLAYAQTEGEQQTVVEEVTPTEETVVEETNQGLQALDPVPGSISILKQTEGGDGTFSFTVLDNNISVTTSNGVGSSSAISLPATETGTEYTITEVTQNGWELVSASCFGGDIVVGKTVEQSSIPSQSQAISGVTTTLYPGQSKSCVFLNRKIPEPLQCNPEVNLIENGDFEAPALSSGTWDIIPSSNTLLKWLVAFISPSVGRLGLEIQNNVAGNSAVGGQHAELDGDNPVTIWQDIPTIAGKQYTLSFKYSPRPGVSQVDNAIQPKVNGSALGAVVSADGSTNSNTVWTTITRTFIGTGSPMKVELADAGSDTSLGGYLDDVKLNCGEPLPPPPQCNANASSTIVSDATTLVNGNPAAVLSFIHSGWTAVIPGATWIWATNPVESPTNDADLTKVFTKTFTIVGTPTGGSLEVAADNNYSVKVNGTTVPVTFDQNNFQLGTQDTYNVLPLLVSGSNTLEFTVTNWEIGQNADPAANPAGLLYKLSLTNDECVVPPPPVQTSTVTMCKVQPLQNSEVTYPLPGWTLMLQGEEVQSGLSIPVNSSAGVNSSTLAAGVSHIAKAVGTWLNQGGANPVDAEYSTTDTWATHMDGYTGYQTDILELQIDNKFDPNSNWGAYNTSHTYAQSFVPTGTSSNFRIFDGTGIAQNEGWFGDNSGSLTVSINKGYAGITQGFDTASPGAGCVEFKNVPYGSYTAAEIMRDGWANVSGLGTVVVDSPTEKFTIVNEPVGTLQINKYSCPADTVLNRTANGVGGTVPEGCVPQAGATFGYTFDNTKVAPDVTGPYKGLGDGAPFIAMPVTDANGLSVKTVPTSGRYLVVETDNSGAQLPASSILGMYCEGDGETNPNNNDNQEITYILGPGNTTKCVAYNKAPVTPPGGPTMVKVHIYKYLKNGEVTAQVPNDSTAPAFPMNSLWSAENIGTASGAYVLGNYEGQGTLKYAADTSNMSAPADYTTEEVTDGSVVVPTNSESCPAGKYRLLGYKSGTSLNAAEAAVLSPTAPIFTDISVDQYVIVVNEKCPDVLGETASSNTTVVKAGDLASDFTAVAATPSKWYFFNDETNTINNTIGSFVTGPETAPIGTGSAQMSVSGTQRRNIATSAFGGIALSSIKSLVFSTYSQLTGDGALGLSERAPYLHFNVDFNGDGAAVYESRLVFVPGANGVVTADEWQTQDAINSGNALWVYSGATWPTTGQPGTTAKTWNQILADYPLAEVHAAYSFLGFRVGEPYADGFTGNVDKVVVGIKTGLNTHTETFDFEPNAPEVCAAGSYTDTSDNSGAIRFENSQGYNTGSINGVNGWSATGAYDYGVVANTFGYSNFNDQAFRISNGITSGSFGDWAFATPNTNGAGESGATAGAFSVGTLQNHFEAQFDIASTKPCAQQEGLRFSVSPDRGDGSRMSYLRFEDSAGGLDVFFDDVTGADDASINFNETQIANDLDRSIPHKVKFVMDFVDGPSNDVVKIYIDGTLVHTGTSWENYYRYDNEASAEQSPRIVKTLIFQARGTAVPANTGKGYLVDNLTLSSSTPVPAPQGGGGGGGGGTGSRSLGGGAPASTGSVLGASTSCGIYLDDFLKMGWKNRVEQVKKLQTFLNDYLKLSPKLPVNGMFGMQTFKAVVKFQEQESDLVLQPWVGVTLKDAKKGTGFVYKTTITRINNIMCPDLNLATPPAVID